jgi:hypothetical protein
MIPGLGISPLIPLLAYYVVCHTAPLRAPPNRYALLYMDSASTAGPTPLADNDDAAAEVHIDDVRMADDPVLVVGSSDDSDDDAQLRDDQVMNPVAVEDHQIDNNDAGAPSDNDADLPDGEEDAYAIGAAGDPNLSDEEDAEDLVLGTLNEHGTRLDNLVDRVVVLEAQHAPVDAEYAIEVLQIVHDFDLRRDLPNKYPGAQRHTMETPSTMI